MPITIETTSNKSGDVYDINGCTSDMLLTIYAALEKEREVYVKHLTEASRFDGKTYTYIMSSTRPAGSLFKNTELNNLNCDKVYSADEDLLFLAEEVRKCSEVMFRIKTTEGVM